MQTVSVGNDLKGLELAKEKLYEAVDKKTVLFLSGGKTPFPLYKKFAKERIITPGAVAMVDERWGKPYHSGSNEKMIKDSGFLDYIREKGIPFYPILKNNKGIDEMTKDYDELVRYLMSWFRKSIAILGMGGDGHIASLPASPRGEPAGTQNSKLKTQKFDEKFVEYFNDFPGEFRERISLTFNALSQMDEIILLVFGNDKKKGLKLLFEEGPVDEVPARFLKTSPITDRTLLITDQKL